MKYGPNITVEPVANSLVFADVYSSSGNSPICARATDILNLPGLGGCLRKERREFELHDLSCNSPSQCHLTTTGLKHYIPLFL